MCVCARAREPPWKLKLVLFSASSSRAIPCARDRARLCKMSEFLSPDSTSWSLVIFELSIDPAADVSLARGDLMLLPSDTEPSPAGKGGKGKGMGAHDVTHDWLGGSALVVTRLPAEGEVGGEGSDRVAAAAAAAAEAADVEANAGGARSHAVSREAAADSDHNQRISATRTIKYAQPPPARKRTCFSITLLLSLFLPLSENALPRAASSVRLGL